MRVQLSRDEASATANALLLKELDMILVAVLKQDWPHNWPRFIDELDAASRSGGEVRCCTCQLHHTFSVSY